MAKDFIINTNGLNTYGFRVLTSGIDTTQYSKNPVLLYMHRRGFDGSAPIGRVENLRVEGDELRGTPIFDSKDPFAAEIERKWEEGFIRMCSAGIDFIELSSSPEHLLQGQTRPTIVRSKLVEVSIVDIGSNDGALQLYDPSGKLLELAAGVDNALLPLLQTITPEPSAGTNHNKPTPPAAEEPAGGDHNKNLFTMNKILLTLGLAQAATEDEAVAAIDALKVNAKKAETIELARIEAAVDTAINRDKKATADKRDHLITLGKTAGFDVLQSTLDMLTPARKPSDIIVPAGGSPASPAVALSYTQLPEEQLLELRKNNRKEYIRLYKAEFGFEPVIED